MSFVCFSVTVPYMTGSFDSGLSGSGCRHGVTPPLTHMIISFDMPFLCFSVSVHHRVF